MTDAELAILTLVAEQPRHGYEIERVIEERSMREWTEVGFSSIYYLLKKMEREGMVEGKQESAERGPARRVYSPTGAGRRALHAAVLDALSIPQPYHNPLQLGLANLPGVPPHQALAALRQYREALLARVEHARSRRDAQRPLPYFVLGMFEHGITVALAEIKWIESFMAQIEEQNSAR